MIRIAILDLYEGQVNQGMRCIREIINQWSEFNHYEVSWDEFDVRLKNEVPDLTYDIYISSGGPGSPLESIGSEWEVAYFNWLAEIENWNNNPSHTNKKHCFFICHSFELICRHYSITQISKRKSTSFGVFPVHLLLEGQQEPVFYGLRDPFYVVDSRDWQVVQPDFDKLKMMGADILCVEKYRAHVPYQQSLMSARFNKYKISTQVQKALL